jgi:hypothetical protein
VIGAEPGTHLPVEIVRNGARVPVDVQLAHVPTQATP